MIKEILKNSIKSVNVPRIKKKTNLNKNINKEVNENNFMDNKPLCKECKNTSNEQSIDKDNDKDKDKDKDIIIAKSENYETLPLLTIDFNEQRKTINSEFYRLNNELSKVKEKNIKLKIEKNKLINCINQQKIIIQERAALFSKLINEHTLITETNQTFQCEKATYYKLNRINSNTLAKTKNDLSIRLNTQEEQFLQTKYESKDTIKYMTEKLKDLKKSNKDKKEEADNLIKELSLLKCVYYEDT